MHQVMYDRPYISPVHYMIGWERESVYVALWIPFWQFAFIFTLYPTFLPKLGVIIICREGDCLLFAIRENLWESKGENLWETRQGENLWEAGAREWPSGKATNGAVPFLFSSIFSFLLLFLFSLLFFHRKVKVILAHFLSICCFYIQFLTRPVWRKYSTICEIWNSEI